ncbi:hypothetical protein GQ53DRAFT_73409 [Thozetella sp. PMI_491]|nr:hypothetical protein GQ53DRAFT_73409 [Thozetella sp. PMI_491]
MEYSLARRPDQVPKQTQTIKHKMSILAMAQPTPHAPFRRDYVWDDSRQSDYASRPRSEDRIALPSIRQAFPELSLRIPLPETSARTPSSTTSPVLGLGSGAMSPSEYVHSPNQNKRRRLSIGDESEERASQVPRLYNNSPRDSLPPSRVLSPPLLTRSVTESWANSVRTTPFSQQNEGLPSMRSPPAIEVERIEPRPTLPSLPFLSFERQSAPTPRVRGHSTDEGYRSMMVHQNASEMENGPAFRPSGYSYPYHHPTRGQSLSLGSIHAFDQRSPFSAGGYGPQYQEYMRIGELGGIGVNGDNKQRKRRGNLPKETTDKLRAWFMAHLGHPYPTEDEKQELMRQTGLQMNQISNWFINARRRQLPTMINNARAESDAMANRNADGKVLPSTERVEFDDGKRSSVPLSDREGSAFEDDLESLKRRHTAGMKRGSV